MQNKKYRKGRGANTGWRQSALAAKSSLHKAYMSTCLVRCPWYSVFFWGWFDFAISCNFFAFWFLLWSLHTIEMIICQRNPLKFETWDSACHLAHEAPVIALKVREGDNFMHTVDLWWCDVVEHDNHSRPWQLNLLAWRSCTMFCWQVLTALRCMKEHLYILDVEGWWLHGGGGWWNTLIARKLTLQLKCEGLQLHWVQGARACLV